MMDFMNPVSSDFVNVSIGTTYPRALLSPVELLSLDGYFVVLR
jgi:hypothetical protein